MFGSGILINPIRERRGQLKIRLAQSPGMLGRARSRIWGEGFTHIYKLSRLCPALRKCKKKERGCKKPSCLLFWAQQQSLCSDNAGRGEVRGRIMGRSPCTRQHSLPHAKGAHAAANQRRCNDCAAGSTKPAGSTSLHLQALLP